MNTDLYPITFPDGGSLSFTGAVPSGGSVNVSVLNTTHTQMLTLPTIRKQ